MKNISNIIKVKGFLPLFLTQLFTTFNDHLFKNALTIIIVYKTVENIGLKSEILVTIAAFLFTLPFFLFSGIAGKIADKYCKRKIAIIVKIVELMLISIAIYAFYLENLWILLSILFLIGAQSTFFIPIKYAIIPQILKEDEMILGNGLISSSTFLSILFGTIIGGIIILTDNGVYLFASISIISSIIGLMSSFYITKTNSFQNIDINFNIFTQNMEIVKKAKEKREIFLSIIGISWFSFIGTIFLTQLPNYTKYILISDNFVVTFLLALFSIGIASGSILCNRLLKGEISAVYAPISLILISFVTLDLYFVSQNLSYHKELYDLSQFLNMGHSFRISLDLFLIAVFGGIYIVPLYSILQKYSSNDSRSRMIGALNIIDAFFITISAFLTFVLLKFDFKIIEIFLLAGFFNFIVAIYVSKLLPKSLSRSIFRTIFKIFFNVKIKGLENYYNCKDRLVIIANHTSFIDAALISSFLPGDFSFAVDKEIYKKWYFKPFFKLADVFPIDPTNPMSVKSMIKIVKQGQKLVIFPEGRLTMTGSLMKIYAGPSTIAQKADADILPIMIYGAEYTIFSRLKGRVKRRLFPKIKLTILPKTKIEIDESLSISQNREESAKKVYDLMTEMIFKSSNKEKTIFESLIESAKINGFSHNIIQDFTYEKLNYRQLILRSFLIGKKISKITKAKDLVGILLPNSNGGVISFFGLQAFNRVTSMLNFSIGEKNLISSIKTSNLKLIITSEKFIKASDLEGLVEKLKEMKIKIVFLEDLASKITIFDKFLGFLSSYFPETYYKLNNKKKDRNHNLASVVLFTSGSEGSPKGVVLSHKNILSNRFQLASKIDLNSRDKVFNSLPIFHSFGLTGGTLLPILSGVEIFLYPSPLHYKIVPELVYSTNSTILFGTNTFLSGYAKFAHNYDFYSLRYVFAGAEKLYPETKEIWIKKFGIRIFEGYGATETSPIISVNTPMENRDNSVGRTLPGIKTELIEIEGVKEGKKLIVSGDNIMLGYLLNDNPGILQPAKNSKYDTGDIVTIDNEGYIYIKGRAKRFAKIAGEMVSLGMIEDCLKKLWPDNINIAISVKDDKKGEKIIVVSDNEKSNKEEILDFFKKESLSEIMIPKEVVFMEKIPVLGSGKIDYVGVVGMVENMRD